MPASVAPFPVFRALDSVGSPLAGGKLYSYQAGTSTPLETYTDSTEAAANTNPVILNASGEANVWLKPQGYKLVLTDADDVVQWTVDNVLVGGTATAGGDTVNVVTYGAVGDGVTNDYSAFAAAAAAAGNWGSVIVPKPVTSYKLNSNVTTNTFWLFMGGATTSGVGLLSGVSIKQVSGGSVSVGSNDVNVSSSGTGFGTSAPFEKIDVRTGNIAFSDATLVSARGIKWLNNVGAAYGSILMDLNTSKMAVTAHAVRFFKASTVVMIDATSTVTGNVRGDYVTAMTAFKIYDGTVDTPTNEKGVIEGDSIRIGYQTSSVAGWSSNNLMYVNSPGELQLMAVNTTGTLFSIIDMYNDGTSTYGDTIFNFRSKSGSLERNVFQALYSGRFVVGTASPLYNEQCGAIRVYGQSNVGGANGNNGLLTLHHTSNSGTVDYVGFRYGNPGSIVGSITYNGSVTAYNTTSDYRVKQNYIKFSDAISVISSIPVYIGEYKTTPGEVSAYCLAHEVQEVVPWAVHGKKDAVNEEGEPELQQLDYSKLVPILLSAVQELTSRLLKLEGQLNG